MEQETSIGSRGLLEYDVDVPGLGHQLHVMSDPCSHEYEYNIGSGLWQAAIELLKYLSGKLLRFKCNEVLIRNTKNASQ